LRPAPPSTGRSALRGSTSCGEIALTLEADAVLTVHRRPASSRSDRVGGPLGTYAAPPVKAPSTQPERARWIVLLKRRCVNWPKRRDRVRGVRGRCCAVGHVSLPLTPKDRLRREMLSTARCR
jgi:hypothetical protein